jgi:hypothetical protein
MTQGALGRRFPGVTVSTVLLFSSLTTRAQQALEFTP